MLVYQLPGAFRRLPRPSSPVIAKASITCTLSLDPITVGSQGSGIGYQGSGPCTFYLAQRHTLTSVFAPTWSRAFCLARPGKIQLNPSHPKLSSSPNAPYLPVLLKSEQPSTLVTVSITSVDRCSVPQSIGAYPRTAPGPVSARGRACTLTPVMVELIGIEPTTPCLQSRCSPKLSYSPVALAVILFPVA